MKTNVKPRVWNLDNEQKKILDDAAKLIQENQEASLYLTAQTQAIFDKKMQTKSQIKFLSFNRMSQLGILYKINKEVLHPLGIALTRDQDLNCSFGCIVANDGIFNFDKEAEDRNDTLFKDFVDLKDIALAPYKQ